MSLVLFEKVIGLLDTIQERIEQLDKARSVVDFDIINKELNNVATAISSVQKVKEL
ncbi:MAG: hypothetical protein GX325_10760, partial [Peptococcaceae bacterium]|nr:hypothetical protein [Peptococcaceae bacterium]